MPETSIASDPLIAQYLDNPLALLLAAGFVVCFSVWKFNKVPRRIVEELKIAPPNAPRLLTTLIKFRLGLTLYALAWGSLFGALALAPDLLRASLDLVIDFGIDPGGTAAKLRDYLVANEALLVTAQPIVAAIAMVVIGQVFPLSRGDEALRATLYKWVEIPFKAESLAADLAGRPFRTGTSAAEGELPGLRHHQIALFQDWVKLERLGAAIGAWSADPDFSRFALRYVGHLNDLRARRETLAAKLETVDVMLGQGDEEKAGEGLERAQGVAAEIAELLPDHQRIVSRAVLASLATERARECALGAMGFEARPVPDRNFPLDATALTLLATSLFVMLTLITLGFYLLPPVVLGLHSETMGQLGVPVSVAWGFWGTVMHFSVVVLAALAREQIRGSALERVLLGRGDSLPVALYAAMGLLGFLVGGIVAVFASYVLYGAFLPDKFAWGAVTFVTGFSVPLHEDRAGRFWGRLGGRNVVDRLLSAHGAAWTVQGAITGTVGVLTYLYLLGRPENAAIDWVFVTFVLVGTGAIGSVVGYYLPAEFHRLKVAGPERVAAAEAGDGPRLGVAA